MKASNKNITNEEIKQIPKSKKSEKQEEIPKTEVIETKKTFNSKLKGYELFIIAGSLALLIAIVLMVNKNNMRAHCRKAICNESGSICYNYTQDRNGVTKKTWQGSCRNR